MMSCSWQKLIRPAQCSAAGLSKCRTVNVGKAPLPIAIKARQVPRRHFRRISLFTHFQLVCLSFFITGAVKHILEAVVLIDLA
jgi:hypothetical protein